MDQSTAKEVSVKQAYEWVRTGHWNRIYFLNWLQAKGVKHSTDLRLECGTLIHRADGTLAYEWIKTKHWNLKQFTSWLVSFL